MTTSPSHSEGIRDALRIAGTVALLSRTLDAALRRETDGLGLADLSTLGQVERGVDLPSAVARRLRLDPGRITRITDRLVDLGYMRREEDAADRRRSRLVLTEPGRERIRVGRDRLASIMNGLLDGLAAPERDDLAAGLEALRVQLDAEQARSKECT